MRGQLLIIHPDKPIEVRLVSHPVPLDEYKHILDDDIEIVPHWDQHMDYGGTLRKAIVLVGAEGIYRPSPSMNFYATALWHYVAASKGLHILHSLTGPVVVCMGDDEFLESVLD